MHNFLQKIKDFSVFELRPEPIAISFNDSSLRFLTLQKKTSWILPENYWREALPKNTVLQGEIKDMKVFVDCLKNGLRKIGIRDNKTVYAVVVLPENITFLEPLTLPKMSEEEIDASLATLVEQNIPLSKEETEADWQFIESDKNDQQTNILIAAAPKTGIEKILEAMHEASIIPVALDLAPLSIVRALINKVNEVEEKPRLIIHFNHDKTIFVLHNGKSIDLAMSSFNGIYFIQKKIAAELHMDPSTRSGQDPLTTFDLMNSEKFFNDSIKEKEKMALENSLSDIIDQINKFKSFEHPLFEKSDIKKRYACQEIVLSGYWASLPIVSSIISQKTDLPVIIGNPWRQNGELNIIPKMNLAESLQFCATIGGAIYARHWFSTPLLK
jgi:type IV pilus assembly protein PilM